MNEEMRKDMFQLFSGDPQSREIVYKFFEEEKMRAFLKGEGGVAYYEELIDIATKANAPLDEVRGRLMPLLDQERFEARLKELTGNFLRSGGMARALDKTLEAREATLNEKRRRFEEVKAIIEQEKENKSWWKRLIS
jgi:hypothetical protein